MHNAMTSERAAQAARAVAALTPREKTLYAAIEHVLGRAQIDPDLHYLLGFPTESFELLCVAEAVCTGLPIDEIKKLRSEDRQPYPPREPDVVRLRRELQAASS